jgi:hypothetical protein
MVTLVSERGPEVKDLIELVVTESAPKKGPAGTTAIRGKSHRSTRTR